MEQLEHLEQLELVLPASPSWLPVTNSGSLGLGELSISQSCIHSLYTICINLGVVKNVELYIK